MHTQNMNLIMNSGETSEPGKDSPPSGKTTLLEELLELGLRTDFLDFQLIVLTLLAGIVALFGLFLNNVAVIIGAMVISPLLEPIYAGTVFLAEGDVRKFLEHMMVALVLILMLIIVSAVITWVLSFFFAFGRYTRDRFATATAGYICRPCDHPWHHRNLCPQEGFYRKCHRHRRRSCTCPPCGCNRNHHIAPADKNNRCAFPHAEQHIRTLCRDADRHSRARYRSAKRCEEETNPKECLPHACVRCEFAHNYMVFSKHIIIYFIEEVC